MPSPTAALLTLVPIFAEDSACRTADPDVFFGETQAEIQRAREICAACPNRAACLEYALANNIKYGVWGGMSDTERRRHKRRNKAA